MEDEDKRIDGLQNEESIDYKWCNINLFINLIEWNGNKAELKEVLEYAVNWNVYFEEEKTINV